MWLSLIGEFKEQCLSNRPTFVMTLVAFVVGLRVRCCYWLHNFILRSFNENACYVEVAEFGYRACLGYIKFSNGSCWWL